MGAAACPAVIFASLVDNPSSQPDLYPTVEAQEKKRQELFWLIEELVEWENSNNEEILKRAPALVFHGDPADECCEIALFRKDEIVVRLPEEAARDVAQLKSSLTTFGGI